MVFWGSLAVGLSLVYWWGTSCTSPICPRARVTSPATLPSCLSPYLPLPQCANVTTPLLCPSMVMHHIGALSQCANAPIWCAPPLCPLYQCTNVVRYAPWQCTHAPKWGWYAPMWWGGLFAKSTTLFPCTKMGRGAPCKTEFFPKFFILLLFLYK